MFWVRGGGGSKHRTYNDRNTSSAPQDNYPLHSRWSLLSPPQYMFHPLQLWSPMHAHRYYTWIQKREVNQTCFFWGGGGVESIRYLKPLFATAAEYQLSWTFLAVLPPLDSAICWPNHLGFLHALGNIWFVLCWNKCAPGEEMGGGVYHWYSSIYLRGRKRGFDFVSNRCRALPYVCQKMNSYACRNNKKLS